MTENEIHIGELIKSIVREKNIRDVDFAEKLGQSRQNVYDLYKRTDIGVKQLLTIGKTLDYDFFRHFTQWNKKSQETEVSIQLKVNSDNIDDLLKWVSENGNINVSKK